MSKLDFRIKGMDCAEEIAVLKREIGPLVGGPDRLSFDLLRAKMSVFDDSSTSAADIMRAVNRTGMKAELWTEHSTLRQAPRAKTSFWTSHGRTVTTAISGILTITGLLLHAALVGSIGNALGSEGLG